MIALTRQLIFVPVISPKPKQAISKSPSDKVRQSIVENIILPIIMSENQESCKKNVVELFPIFLSSCFSLLEALIEENSNIFNFLENVNCDSLWKEKISNSFCAYPNADIIRERVYLFIATLKGLQEKSQTIFEKEAPQIILNIGVIGLQFELLLFCLLEAENLTVKDAVQNKLVDIYLSYFQKYWDMVEPLIKKHSQRISWKKMDIKKLEDCEKCPLPQETEWE